MSPEPISLAAAARRKRFASGSHGGVAYRVYTQQQFDEFPQYDATEATTAHAGRLLLQQLRFGLSALGEGTLLRYLDEVPRSLERHSEGLLRMLGAFEGSAEGVTLGTMGLALSALNVEPMSGLVVLLVRCRVPLCVVASPPTADSFTT